MPAEREKGFKPFPLLTADQRDSLLAPASNGGVGWRHLSVI
jgi:hypothetical protein